MDYSSLFMSVFHMFTPVGEITQKSRLFSFCCLNVSLHCPIGESLSALASIRSDHLGANDVWRQTV